MSDQHLYLTFNLFIQERERHSPPFNHLRLHPFSEGVSALQIYCMKEGVKVPPNSRQSILKQEKTFLI